MCEYHSYVLSASQALFGTFPPNIAHIPSFHISYYSFTIIHVSASSSYCTLCCSHARGVLSLLCKIPLQSKLNGPFYFGLSTTPYSPKTALCPVYNNNNITFYSFLHIENFTLRYNGVSRQHVAEIVRSSIKYNKCIANTKVVNIQHFGDTSTILTSDVCINARNVLLHVAIAILGQVRLGLGLGFVIYLNYSPPPHSCPSPPLSLAATDECKAWQPIFDPDS